jgi:hypothetical protein
VNYSGLSYSFSVPAPPMAWTVASISLPSGELSSEVCGLGGGGSNLTSHCDTTTNASTIIPLQHDNFACTSTSYRVISEGSLEVQGGTTVYFSSTTITYSYTTTYETSVTVGNNDNNSTAVGESIVTTVTNPPNSWVVISCTEISTTT